MTSFGLSDFSPIEYELEQNQNVFDRIPDNFDCKILSTLFLFIILLIS
jgi:hypothetical protein